MFPLADTRPVSTKDSYGGFDDDAAIRASPAARRVSLEA